MGGENSNSNSKRGWARRINEWGRTNKGKWGYIIKGQGRLYLTRLDGKSVEKRGKRPGEAFLLAVPTLGKGGTKMAEITADIELGKTRSTAGKKTFLG